MNVVEEAVAELLPYKELFTSVVPEQVHLVFMFTPAGQSCNDKFQFKCKRN